MLALLGCVNIWSYWNTIAQLDHTLTVLMRQAKVNPALCFRGVSRRAATTFRFPGKRHT